MSSKSSGSNVPGNRFASMLAGWCLPITAVLAHGPEAAHEQNAGWMLAISGQAIVTLSLGFLAGMLAVYLRQSAWARAGLAAIAVALPLTSFTQIAVIPVPHVLVNGEPANADEVNQNFQAVVQQIADHANSTALHGGGSSLTSVDGLLGGTITGDVTIDGGRLIVDEVALRNDASEPRLFLGISDSGDGFLVYSEGDVEKSSLILTPNGDAIMIGFGNMVVQSRDASVIVRGGDSGSVNILSKNSTNMASDGAFAIDATTIELNAPNDP